MATAFDKAGGHGRQFGVRRIMCWTAAREEKLLALWKSRRCLFDPNAVVTKGERQQALTQVAAEMDMTGSVAILRFVIVVGLHGYLNSLVLR